MFSSARDHRRSTPIAARRPGAPGNARVRIPSWTDDRWISTRPYQLANDLRCKRSAVLHSFKGRTINDVEEVVLKACVMLTKATVCSSRVG